MSAAAPGPRLVHTILTPASRQYHFGFTANFLQVLFGCCVALVSVIAQVHLRPYQQAEANVLKALVEALVFFTFLISFILRLLETEPDLANDEPYDRMQYGDALVVAIYFVLMAAVWLTVGQIRRKRQFCKGLTADASLLGFDALQVPLSEVGERSQHSTSSRHD